MCTIKHPCPRYTSRGTQSRAFTQQTRSTSHAGPPSQYTQLTIKRPPSDTAGMHQRVRHRIYQRHGARVTSRCRRERETEKRGGRMRQRKTEQEGGRRAIIRSVSVRLTGEKIPKVSLSSNLYDDTRELTRGITSRRGAAGSSY